MTSAVLFSAGDSAPAGTTIVYRSYPGETATFVGSTSIESSRITKVTEGDTDSYGNKILDRVTDTLAKENLYKIDLNDVKNHITPLTEWGWSDPDSSQGTWSANYRPAEIFIDGKLLTWSRWPNEEEDNGMVKIASAVTSDNFKSQS